MAISVQQAVLYGEELVARKEKRFAEAAARKRKVEMREKAKAIMNTKKVKKNIVAVTKKPQTVDECLLKLFDNVMQLKNAKLLHDNKIHAKTIIQKFVWLMKICLSKISVGSYPS